MCPPGYHQNVFVVTHELGYMIYGYILPMNQRVRIRLSKKCNISGQKWFMKQHIKCPSAWMHELPQSHVIRPAQDSSVWLGLTSTEQLMSPECSKHQVLSLAKMLVVNEQKIFCSHQCSAECSMNTFRAYISTYTCFVLPRTHQCGLR